MTGEYPYLYHEADFSASGYDGELTEDMTICVRATSASQTAGRVSSSKTASPCHRRRPQLLSTFPFEAAFAS